MSKHLAQSGEHAGHWVDCVEKHECHLSDNHVSDNVFHAAGLWLAERGFEKDDSQLTEKDINEFLAENPDPLEWFEKVGERVRQVEPPAVGELVQPEQVEEVKVFRDQIEALYAKDRCHELARFIYESNPSRFQLMEMSVLDDLGERYACHWFVWDQHTNMYVDIYGESPNPQDIAAHYGFAETDHVRFHRRSLSRFLHRSEKYRPKAVGSDSTYEPGWEIRAQEAADEMGLPYGDKQGEMLKQITYLRALRPVAA